MAERALKAADSSYLLDLRTELADEYRDQDDDLDAYRDVREMRVPALAESDRKYQLVSVDPRDPDVTEESLQQTAILTLERPKLFITGGEGDTQQTLATDREHWTEETLWRCGTREPGADTMTQVTDAALNDGGGWAKILWAADLWEARYRLKGPKDGDETDAYVGYDKATEEAKKRAGPPFAWCYVDPRTIYPVWSGGRLCEVLEITKRTVRSTFRRYRLGRDQEGNIVPEELSATGAMNDIRENVDFIEHWDDTWVTYAVVGKNRNQDPTGYIVKQFKHKYPFGVPYDFAPGLMMNHWRGRKVGWGIGHTKLWLVKYRAFLRALHANYVARDLLPPLVTYGDTPAMPIGTGDGLPREPAELHPGEILNLAPGRQLQTVPMPPPDTLERHMQLIDNAIMQLESPRVTTLSGMEGAGFAISQILSYTRTRVGPIRHNLERLLEGQTEKLWTLVRERAGEKVWVFYSGSDNDSAGYLGLGPADFERPMQIRWAVQAELPTDEMLRVRTATERLNNGTWGADEAVTYLGDNPDEIRRSRMRDEIRSSPQYKQYLMAQVFMNAGRGDLLAKAGEAEQMAMQGQLPPPGGQGPGVFEGGGPGQPSVPDLAALAATPNGAGVTPPGTPAPYQAGAPQGLPPGPGVG